MAQRLARLTVLIGVPGSGKSTLAARWLRDRPTWRVVATDAIRAELFGAAHIQGPWPLIWQAVEQQFRDSVRLIQAGEVDGVIYDATNAVRQHRRAAIALARQCGFKQITGWWLNLPLALCLARNQARDRPVPAAIIDRMHRRLLAAPPSVADGLNTLVITGHFCPEREAERSQPGDRGLPGSGIAPRPTAETE